MLADLVVLFHLTFVAFVATGGWLVLVSRRVAWLHLPCAAWGVWIETSGGLCPLTPLENALRAQAGRPTYAGDFVGRYLLPVLYPQGLTREVQVGLAVGVVVVNVVPYVVAWRRRGEGG